MSLDAAVGGADACWGRFRKRGGRLIVEAAILVHAACCHGAAGRVGDIAARNVRGGPWWIFTRAVFTEMFEAAEEVRLG